MDQMTNSSTKQLTKIISDAQLQKILLVNLVGFCGVISILGSVGNVINMIVFYRQGLDTTTNISFFSLSVSDLCSLILQQLFNVCINPLFQSLNLPLVYLDLLYITAAIPRGMFAKITCMVTAYITAERCLCVVFPLHVKRLVTPRITRVAMIIIYLFTLITNCPIYFTSYFTWKFYPESNTTRLGLGFTDDFDITQAFLFLTHGIVTLGGFLSVLTFTLILIYKLGQKSSWRQTANADQEKGKTMSKRDRGAMVMVVLIASISVICYTPASLLGVATFVEPEICLNRRYHNFFYSGWSLAMLFENINSSVNVILYYRMSSKYRHTFRELFCRHLKSDKNKMTTATTQDV